MKKIVKKAYWNPEKEQIWINQMAAKGLALTDYSCWRYVFEETKPGEFIYRIDLLEQDPGHPESEVFLKFLEDSGVQVVATYFKWVYLRKRSADGPFEVYSDIGSRIRLYRRILQFWASLLAMMTVAVLVNLGVFIAEFIATGTPDMWVNFACGILCTLIGILMFITLVQPVKKQIKKTQREASVFE